jgi:hypothetical protein
LKRAIRAYYKARGERPEWLPEAMTPEEKQVLEEEEMIERYYKALGRLGEAQVEGGRA